MLAGTVSAGYLVFKGRVVDVEEAAKEIMLQETLVLSSEPKSESGS